MLRIDIKHKRLVRFRWPTYGASLLFVLVFAVFILAAQNKPIQSPAEIFRQARSSVVLIVGSTRSDEVAQGSGFIVGKDKVVTNYHVVAGLSTAYVLFADGHTEQVAEVLAADTDQDIAILGIHTGTRPPLPLGDELILREGESVLAIGAPRGLELSVTNGIISAFRNSEKKFLIQNTAPIAPGSSGGPLLDSRGRVVGLTTSLLVDTPGVYFSVGIGAVKRLLKIAPTLSQSFAEWAAANGAKPSAGLRETFEWIKSKLEEKAGGTSRDYFALPGKDSEMEIYDLQLQQSGDGCVFLCTFKRNTIDHNHVADPAKPRMADLLDGCVESTVNNNSYELPMYYLESSTIIPKGKYNDLTTLALKFSEKKVSRLWDIVERSMTGCRHAEFNASPEVWEKTQEMIADTIRRTTGHYDRKPNKSEPSDLFSLPLGRFPDEENEVLAKRLGDAFNHAAALCSKRRPAAKEPF